MNKWEIFPHDLLVEDKDGLFIRGHYFSPTLLPNGHLSLIRILPKTEHSKLSNKSTLTITFMECSLVLLPQAIQKVS